MLKLSCLEPRGDDHVKMTIGPIFRKALPLIRVREGERQGVVSALLEP